MKNLSFVCVVYLTALFIAATISLAGVVYGDSSNRSDHVVIELFDGGTAEGPLLYGKQRGHWVVRNADGSVDRNFLFERYIGAVNGMTTEFNLKVAHEK